MHPPPVVTFNNGWLLVAGVLFVVFVVRVARRWRAYERSCLPIDAPLTAWPERLLALGVAVALVVSWAVGTW